MSLSRHETKRENKAEAEGKEGREGSSRFKTGWQTQADGFITGGMGTLTPDRNGLRRAQETNTQH
jgi:hypothetical protein